MSRHTEHEEEEGEVHDLLTRLQLDPSISQQMMSLKELPLNDVTRLKQRVELELNKYTDLLAAQNVDMISPLVTADGYPREDVDVLQVRLIRRNINMLRNDLSNIIDYSHTLLSSHFGSSASYSHGQNKNVDGTSVLDFNTSSYTIPFAIVNEIVPNSPADVAGIIDNDKVIAIGSIHAGNHSKLKNISNEILSNEDKPLQLKILRGEEMLNLQLIPNRNWGGRGLLGCRLKEL